jgi:hypothetical protein
MPVIWSPVQLGHEDPIWPAASHGTPARDGPDPHSFRLLGMVTIEVFATR